MESKSLNPLIWDVNKKLHDPIREKLIKTAEAFLKDVEMGFNLENLYLTGSLCTYEWSAESDWDIHIVVKIKENLEDEVAKDYFEAKSKVFNKDHKIMIKGYPTEVNLKLQEEFHKGKAIYDLVKNKWVVEPVHPKVTLKTPEVLELTHQIEELIDNAVGTKAPLETLKKVGDEIKDMRKKGLEKDGEYSVGNLVFKNLRHSGSIKKLYDYKAKVQDAALSLESFSKFFFKS